MPHNAITPFSPVNSFKLDQDHKRSTDHSRKYSRGTFTNGARVQPVGRRFAIKFQNHHDSKQLAQKHANDKLAGKHPVRVDDDTTTAVISDSSEEEIHDASTAPEPDADVAYSFDAATGPSVGSDVLSAAISKAVERFENKATEKLIRDEYDVVEDKEDFHEGYAADEDDFELV